LTLRLTAEEVRRARGWGQLLGEGPAGTGAAGVAEVLSTLVGVQGQDLAAAGLCLRARTSGLVAVDVGAALSGDGAAVLMWTLRGTRHLHPGDDVRWLLGLLGPVFNRPGRRAEQLGIGGETGRTAVEALRRALESDGPLTRRQVRDLLAPVGVDPSGQAPVHVLRSAALEGILCIVPGAGAQERYELLDERVQASPPVEPAPAAAKLVRRYLAAYAPATPADFAAWSGLPAGSVRRAWADVAGELTEGDTPGGPAWVLTARVEAVVAAAGAGPLPVRLSGGFDTVLLGYADRRLVIDPGNARRVNPGGGIIRPVVVSDGSVVGTWAYRRRGRSHTVEVDPFRPFTPAERSAVVAEVADVGRFLGSDPSLAWLPPDR